MSDTLQTLNTENFSFLTRVMLNAEMKKAELLAAKETETDDETPAPNKRKIVKVAAILGGIGAAFAVYKLTQNVNDEDSENDYDETGESDNDYTETQE